ncbi:hypothetical protein [Lysinibacillus sp. NPDC056220]|uniref:hypothetical protein n=1 Tax=Lysinibacillus sp. NPDC056220 TaxID=3398580 RepID=UPI003BF4FF63
MRYGVAEKNAVQYFAKLLKQFFLKRIEEAMKPNESEQHTEKDDDTMKFTSTTAKAAVHDYIQQAVDKGLINESWLEKFDNGTITSGDFEGLKIIIAQRSA